MGTISVEWLADEINNYIENPKSRPGDSCIYSNGLFWAAGLIRETASVWKNPTSYNRLCDGAKLMADRYIQNNA